MVEPTIDELLTKADSKYSLVCAAAKRAREIVDGAEPMNSGDAKNRLRWRYRKLVKIKSLMYRLQKALSRRRSV